MKLLVVLDQTNELIAILYSLEGTLRFRSNFNGRNGWEVVAGEVASKTTPCCKLTLRSDMMDNRRAVIGASFFGPLASLILSIAVR